MGKLEVSEKDLATIKVGKINCVDESEKRMIRQRCVELALEKCKFENMKEPVENITKMAKTLSDFIIG